MANVKEKTVKIKIPLVRGGNNDDVFVSVNDRDWLIKRGIEVEVPECAKEVLENQEKQLYAATMYEDSLSKASSEDEKNNK